MSNKIIYIAGYGRSGSTILEMSLSNTLEVFPTGELSNLFEFYSNNGQCECGKLIQDCPFWKEIIEACGLQVELEYSDNITKKAESVGIGKLFEKEWEAVWSRLMNSIVAKSGYNAILDSSKSTRKNFYRSQYLRNLGFDVSEILLIRNPVDVMKSAKKGSNKLLEKGDKNAVKFGGAYRAGISWLITNYFVFNRLKSNEDIIITYDSFVDDPKKLVSKVKNLYSLNYRMNNDEKHGISGNRLRRNSKDDLIIKRKKNKIELNSLEKILAAFLNKYYKSIINNNKYICI